MPYAEIIYLRRSDQNPGGFRQQLVRDQGGACRQGEQCHILERESQCFHKQLNRLCYQAAMPA